MLRRATPRAVGGARRHVHARLVHDRPSRSVACVVSLDQVAIGTRSTFRVLGDTTPPGQKQKPQTDHDGG